MTRAGVLAPAVPPRAPPAMWPLALPNLMTAASPALACHMAAISGFRRQTARMGGNAARAGAPTG